METKSSTAKKAIIALFKDFSKTHTVTSLANAIGLSRVGTWKLLKKLEADRCVKIRSVGSGKTSTTVVAPNWDNTLLEKRISLYLAEEAAGQRRWQVNFSELESTSDFVILYGSILKTAKQANDIDILVVAGKKKIKDILARIGKIQQVQSRKIHQIIFTPGEFAAELQKPNPAFIDAVRNSVILSGQEAFVKFMKKV